MTPTEQDKELRRLISDLMADLMVDVSLKKLSKNDGDILENGLQYIKSHNSRLNLIMQLITADRERVALEARLNGKWEILSKIPDGTSVLENGKIGSAYELRIKVNREIAELKAQKEKLL